MQFIIILLNSLQQHQHFQSLIYLNFVHAWYYMAQLELFTTTTTFTLCNLFIFFVMAEELLLFFRWRFCCGILMDFEIVIQFRKCRYMCTLYDTNTIRQILNFMARHAKK